jgi:hypothetical protein
MVEVVSHWLNSRGVELRHIVGPMYGAKLRNNKWLVLLWWLDNVEWVYVDIYDVNPFGRWFKDEEPFPNNPLNRVGARRLMIYVRKRAWLWNLNDPDFFNDLAEAIGDA